MLILPCRASPTTADRQSFAPLSAVRSTKSQDPSPSRLSRTAGSDSANHGPSGWLVLRPPPRAWNGQTRCRETWSQQQPAAAREAVPGNPLPPVCILRPGGNAADLLPFVSDRVPRRENCLAPSKQSPIGRSLQDKVTKADSGVCVGPSIAKQDSKPARMRMSMSMSMSISPRQEHKRRNPWTAGVHLAAMSATRDQVGDGGPTRDVRRGRR